MHIAYYFAQSLLHALLAVLYCVKCYMHNVAMYVPQLIMQNQFNERKNFIHTLIKYACITVH